MTIKGWLAKLWRSHLSEPELTDDADMVEFIAHIDETFDVSSAEMLSHPNVTLRQLVCWLWEGVAGKCPNVYALDLLNEVAPANEQELARSGAWEYKQIEVIVLELAGLWLGLYPANLDATVNPEDIDS